QAGSTSSWAIPSHDFLRLPDIEMATVPFTTTTSYNAFATVAPLTTIWTPPSSCLSPTPTLIGGTCINSRCSAYSPWEITQNWDAWVNFAYWTTSYSQVSTACAPPSSQLWIEFSYSPARGCPSGYKTASSSSRYDGDLSVICCPS